MSKKMYLDNELKKTILLLSFCLFCIDLLYPITFTYDSGHYFSYIPFFDGSMTLENWDAIRGPTFPLLTFIFISLLGKTMNALILPAAFFHVSLFLISVFLILSSFLSLKGFEKKILVYVVFLFIGLDPLIVGFYHAFLTEYVASTIALISCLFSFLLYKNFHIQRRFWLIITGFSLLVPIAYHLKQPYIGAALFPLLLISLIILRNKHFNRKETLKLLLGIVIVASILLISIFGWNAIIQNETTSGATSILLTAIAQNYSEFKKSPINWLEFSLENYLALSNIYKYNLNMEKDWTNQIEIESIFSFNHSLENKTIAYRMYERNKDTNIAVPDNYPFEEYLKPFSSFYYPPRWLNIFFTITSNKSTFLFSFLYLFLPFGFIAASFFILLSKPLVDDFMIIFFVTSGSAFFNAFAHSFMYNPIDRYIFWGYPLILISALIVIIRLISVFKTNRII